MEKLTYTVSAQLANGPKLASAGTVDVEAYGKFSATIAAGAADLEVALPWGSGGKAAVLLMKPSKPSDTLSYKVNDKSAASSFALNGPHLLLGTGAVALLDPAPARLFFSNAGTEDLAVEILIGGDATPGP